MRIDVKPVAKARPRVNKTSGHIYTPNSTQNFERTVRQAYISQGGDLMEGDLGLYLAFSKEYVDLAISPIVEGWGKRSLRGDIDNYTKAVMDALNGAAYDDDKQIRRLVVEL